MIERTYLAKPAVFPDPPRAMDRRQVALQYWIASFATARDQAIEMDEQTRRDGGRVAYVNIGIPAASMDVVLIDLRAADEQIADLERRRDVAWSQARFYRLLSYVLAGAFVAAMFVR